MKRELRERRAWKPGTGSRRALEAWSGKSHCLPGLHRGWGLAVEGRQELKVCCVSGDPEQGLLCCKDMASKAENREGWGGGEAGVFTALSICTKPCPCYLPMPSFLHRTEQVLVLSPFHRWAN